MAALANGREYPRRGIVVPPAPDAEELPQKNRYGYRRFLVKQLLGCPIYSAATIA
jgi:hypothetical protein